MNKKKIKSILRVNHAGEYGATCIYAGQRYVVGQDKTLQHMAEQEEKHLKLFNQLMIKHRVRPSILQPLWYIGGFILGSATAALGKKYAHACTIAVEDVIEDHYNHQLEELDNGENNPQCEEIKQVIKKCRDEEIEHKNQAIDEGGIETKKSYLMSLLIRSVVKASIAIAKKI